MTAGVGTNVSWRYGGFSERRAHGSGVEFFFWGRVRWMVGSGEAVMKRVWVQAVVISGICQLCLVKWLSGFDAGLYSLGCYRMSIFQSSQRFFL